MVRLTTKIKQLKAEKESTLKTLDEIDRSLLDGTIHEPTYKELKRKYDSRLIRIEQDIFELEKTQKERKEKRKKRTVKLKMKKPTKEPTISPEPTITLEGLKLRRDYIQKTVSILEDNDTMSLDQAITTLLTERSQMGEKLTASEITEELRLDRKEHVAKNEVIDSLRALVDGGHIKRIEDPYRNLRYYIDLSWKVGSLPKV